MVLWLLSWLLLAGSASAQSSNPAAALPTRRMLNRHGLEQAWWTQATMNVSRDKVRYLTVDEEVAYVQASSGVVTAFDSETGKRLWAVQLGRRDQHSYRVVSNESVAFFVNGMTLYALEKFKGEVLWQIRLPAAPSTSPAADENQVYVGALDGSVYAFDLRKIHQYYDKSLLPQWSYQTLNWRYKTAKKVTTPAIATGRIVNFASRDGSLYAVTALERDLVFQFETDAPVSAPLKYSEGFVYLASEDFNFFCINVENGQVRWEFVSGLPVRKSPRVVGEQVFLLPTHGGMYCLSTDSGKQQWWRPKTEEFLAATPSLVYATDQLGNVVILSRDDGATLGALPLRRFSTRVANDRTDRLYLSTESGLVVCIREQGREFPLYHLYPERRPILPEFASETPQEKPLQDKPDKKDEAKADNKEK